MSRQTDGGKQMLTKNQLVEAQITAMSSDGNGIAKVDGMVIFVPYSAVGDKLLVRVVKVLKHYSFGIIDRILESGEGRVQDSCRTSSCWLPIFSSTSFVRKRWQAKRC